MSRADIIRYARALHDRGWVANHDGNLSERAGARRFLATPTATSKADVDDRNLIVVDDTGARVSGTARPFSEMKLHLAVYARRADVNAVVHAHPPHATAIACSGSTVLERPFIAEAVVSLGARIPTVPYAPPADAPAALAPYADDYDAVLLGNHGAIAWGSCLEQAYLRLELVEHLARIALAAIPTGGVRPLPDDALPALLAARAKAGLGAAADKAGRANHAAAADKARASAPRAVVACAPAPHSPVPTRAPGTPDADRVARLVREEILRALKDT